MMDRRRVIVSIGGVALAWPLPARTQASRRVARIGIVSVGGPRADMTGALPNNRNVRAFLRGMAELGYVYSRDLVTVPRGIDNMAAIPDLVGLQIDVIVATDAETVLSLLKEATTTIPIVMTPANDPVGERFVQSLERPGGNLTGMSLQSLELTAKRLHLLKELVPRAEKVGIVWDSTSPKLWPVAQAVGLTNGWKLLSVEIRDFREIETAFKTAANDGAGALLVPASGLLFSRAREIAELAAMRRLPAMYELRPFVDSGGLVSYGANIEDIWRRAATYVDKILRGAKPAELPIEQPTKFELVINSTAAKALGLTISPSILIRADEVID